MLGSLRCFNTQPPEGGWGNLRIYASYDSCFNTQPPEGGWGLPINTLSCVFVSTHSRPKAAGCSLHNSLILY